MIYCLKAQLLKDSMELNLLLWPERDPKWTFSWAKQTSEMLQESNFPFYEALPLEWRSLFKHIAHHQTVMPKRVIMQYKWLLREIGPSICA